MKNIWKSLLLNLTIYILRINRSGFMKFSKQVLIKLILVLFLTLGIASSVYCLSKINKKTTELQLNDNNKEKNNNNS